MSAMQRRKGAAGEREFCSLLGEELGMALTRRLGQARDSGCDLVIGAFAVEIKRQERAALSQWWRQAVVSAQAERKMPALAFRESRKPWCVALPWNWYEDKRAYDATLDHVALMFIPGFACAVRETL